MKKYMTIAMLGASMLTACSQSSETDMLAVNPEANMAATADEGRLSDAAQAVYEQRFQIMVGSFQNGGATTVYDTFADIAGTENYKPLASAAPDAQMMDALSVAQDYAAQNNSLAFMVVHKGKVIANNYYGDTTFDTPINSKSLAKPMGIIAIGRAIQKGHIKSLDQPVSDFVTEWQGTPKEKILIRHLLDMRSGLLEQGWAPEATSILNRAYLHPYHDEVIINEYPLKHEPGVRYDYSNANSELVAPIIKRATGVSYEDWVSQEVVMPLGALGGTVWINREGGTAHSGCCMQLPAETWLRLGVLVMQDGVWDAERFLPDGFVEQMKTPTSQNSHVGMGIYNGAQHVEWRGAGNPDVDFGKTYHSEPYKDLDLTLFDGNSNQVVYMVPSKDLIILRVGDNPPKEKTWDNAFLPNTLSAAF